MKDFGIVLNLKIRWGYFLKIDFVGIVYSSFYFV